VSVALDTTGAYAVRPAGGSSSHLVGGLAQADALAVVDPDVTEVAVGHTVPIILLRERGALHARLEAERRSAESGGRGNAGGRPTHRDQS